MKKADSLRAFIAEWFPELARDPQRLRMWVETGKVRTLSSAGRDFEWQYTLQVMVEDFAGDASGLAVVLSEWCRLHQPDLLQADAGVPFEADILDAGSYDVSFSLPLSEPVLVSDRPGGGWLLEHPDEPAPIFADEDPLGILREIWHDGERIVPLPEG